MSYLSTSLLMTLTTVFVVDAGAAQSKTKPAKFPERGWKLVKMKDKKRRGLDHSLMTALDPKTHVFELTLERPPGWNGTVITDSKGLVLVRGAKEAFEIPNMDVGFRFSLYITTPRKRQCLLFRELFVRLPYRDFPVKGWKPAKVADLELKGTRQFTPKTMFESFDFPHSISFRPAKSRRASVYVMVRIEAGKSQKIASQSMTGKLLFWAHAKKGEQFRTYQIFPHDRTYRTTDIATVEKDYPLGK